MKQLLFLYAVYAQSIFAAEPVYISLGSNCTPAFRLTSWGLRTAAYPFDWIISPFNSLYAALDDDFEHFFKNLIVDYTGTSVSDHYSLDFHHVWHEHFPNLNQLPSVDWQSKIPLIEEKQSRRIERFRRICNSNETVIFVRYDDIDKESAQYLRNLIKSKYPNLTFVLVVAKDSEEFQEPWNIPQIINFSLVHSDLYAWKAAFEQISSLFGCHSKIKASSFKPTPDRLDTLIPDGLTKEPEEPKELEDSVD